MRFYELPYMLACVSVPADAAANADAVRQIHASGRASVTLPACPFMHGTGWLLIARPPTGSDRS